MSILVVVWLALGGTLKSKNGLMGTKRVSYVESSIDAANEKESDNMKWMAIVDWGGMRSGVSDEKVSGLIHFRSLVHLHLE